MTIKRYLVKDMNEALVRIRYELGNDAIIVSTRWIRPKGFKNLFKRKMLEVTAAVERKQPIVPVNHSSKPQQSHNHQVATQQSPDQDEKNEQLEKEIRELKEMIESLMKEKSKKKGGRKKLFSTILLQHLKNMDLDDEIVKDFSAYCKSIGSSQVDADKAREYFTNLFQKNIILENKTDVKVWAFVGPTGVGKTTTIAKIAAKETLEKKKKVGLITMDTYRIGAVDQLKTYANILNIPLEVVSNREDMYNAIDNLQSCDRILIDSAGMNCLAKDQLLNVKDSLSQIGNRLNILVVSATTKSRDLKMILDNYEDIGYDSIILTKLDETQCYGSILNINHYTDKPICYVTTGQNVPEDIRLVSAEDLQDYVLRGVEA